ncbi:hypothetical protein BIY24_08170 [Halobacteriovorax marinus]|uniref:hypothetical protein n=1 Tax=Halobacteriovorax marinus TaxID=97084 RepID=UPI000BC31237|nr:hypothetical protein [Halobacteriovorax marinus]ATH07926.1 hypothetical protein BIY24_08170 [Halobacteriovorax marinus]
MVVLKAVNRKKVIAWGVLFLVILSIFLASYFEEDNLLKDEAIKMGDSYYCKDIETQFIKEKCYKIIEKKKELLANCQSKYGEKAKQCNNLAY